MWGANLCHRTLVTSPVLKRTPTLLWTPQRTFCFRWFKKYREVFYPSSWNTPDKRSSDNMKMGSVVKYRTQDPLFMDDRIRHIEGGVNSFITRLHDEGVYDLPLRTMAFLMYNSAREGRRDRLMFKKFEENYHNLISDKVHPREAFGGVWACYTSGMASLEGIAHWESKLEEHTDYIHVRDIIQLLQAFNKQKQLKRDHMIDWMNRHYKKRLLQVWDKEILFNQRAMYDLMNEFYKLEYIDDELSQKFITSINTKNKIQNLYFFDVFYNFFHNMNENPKCGLYGKLEKEIKQYEEKHYTEDFKWKYDLKERRPRTHKELIAIKDRYKWEEFERIEMKDERSEREKERIEAAQQLKNAVYNEELFIKVVKKMMDEGKTLIEMMVYLDVSENQLQDAFSLISQKEQVQKLEELRKQNKLPFEKKAEEKKA